MAWTNPSDPVASTVITVAYAVANLLTQIRWLRTLTGGADPGGSSQVVVSSSTTATAWGQVPTAAIADAAVTSAKLADNSVAGAKILDSNIANVKLVDATIQTGKIADNAITTAKILNANVTAGKLEAGAAAANLGFTPALVAAGTYTGDGSGSPRQFATGFIPKLVVLTWTSGTFTGMAVLYGTALSIATYVNGPPTSGTGTVAFSSDGGLHASDGFSIGLNGGTFYNTAGTTFYYKAMK